MVTSRMVSSLTRAAAFRSAGVMGAATLVAVAVAPDCHERVLTKAVQREVPQTKIRGFGHYYEKASALSGSPNLISYDAGRSIRNSLRNVLQPTNRCKQEIGRKLSFRPSKGWAVNLTYGSIEGEIVNHSTVIPSILTLLCHSLFHFLPLL